MKIKGISLLELNLVIILIVLLSAFLLPNFFKSFELQHYRYIRNQLLQAIRFARIEAINTHQKITITPTNHDWCNGWEIMQAGKSLKSFYVKSKQCEISWESFPDKSDLSFLPQGTTDYQNGTFSFYYHSAPLWNVVISQTGRVRIQ